MQLERVTKQRVVAATTVHGIVAAARLLVEMQGIAEEGVAIPTAANQVGAAQPATLQKTRRRRTRGPCLHRPPASRPHRGPIPRWPRVAEQPVGATVTGRQRKAGIRSPDLVAGGERVAKANIARTTTDQHIVMAGFRTNTADEFHGARRDQCNQSLGCTYFGCTYFSPVATLRRNQAGSPDQLQSQQGAGGACDPDQGRGAGQGATALELGDERRCRAHPLGQLGLGEPGVGARLDDRSRDLQGRIKVVPRAPPTLMAKPPSLEVGRRYRVIAGTDCRRSR